MERAQRETVCARQPPALRPVPVPSSALLARLAPLTPVPGRPDLVAHHAPDVFALWQAWEEECGAPQAVPFWPNFRTLLSRILYPCGVAVLFRH